MTESHHNSGRLVPEAFITGDSSSDDRKRDRGDSDAENHNSTPVQGKRRRQNDDLDIDGRNIPENVVSGTFSHEDYTIGWICALHIELAAPQAMLDATHPTLPSSPADTNTYTFGRIAKHNIIVACLLSGHYGTNNAASVASNLRRSFPSVQLGLMVGIGGGVPGKADIRLGDVVVGDKGVIQFDLGKAVGDGQFRRTGSLSKPPPALLTAVAKLRADHVLRSSQIPSILSKMLEENPSMIKYAHCGTLQDRLYDCTYEHTQSIDDCSHCDESRTINRPTRSSTDPHIHYGLIASGNQVMKHGRIRDQLAQELDVLCFEMEAAGVTDNVPCLAIRGICDYSDSHKSKPWQEYAAATAAAYAKELLCVRPSSGPQKTTERTLVDIG